MRQCLICEDPYQPFMSFGRMPLANGFLTAEQFADEYFYELKVGFCRACKMVQLAELVDPKKMFHANYPFDSFTSMRMAAHFKEFAELVMAKYLNSADPFVVELGSNDGIMLQHFAGRQIRHLGVEPSDNVAQRAVEQGIQTICKFFDEELACDIVAEQGQADVLLGANVMCHMPDLHSVAAGVLILLKPGGFLLFEDPYLGDGIEKTAYDQIYDEHAFYFFGLFRELSVRAARTGGDRCVGSTGAWWLDALCDRTSRHSQSFRTGAGAASQGRRVGCTRSGHL